MPAGVSYHSFENGVAAIHNFTDNEVFAGTVGDALPEGAGEVLGMARITESNGVRGILLPPRTIALSVAWPQQAGHCAPGDRTGHHPSTNSQKDLTGGLAGSCFSSTIWNPRAR